MTRPITDTKGRPYLNINNAKNGMTVWLDGGFTCIEAGPVALHDNGRAAWFYCLAGVHELVSQCVEGDYCIGIYPQRA